MKIISVVSFLAFVLLQNPKGNSNENIRFNYVGVETWGKSSHILYFCIENSSSDTVYLSWDNIKVEVKKGPLIIQNEKIIGQGFPPPLENQRKRKILCKDKNAIIKLKENLKEKFAESLFKTNFSKRHFNKADRKFIEQSISNSCIVLLPHSTTNYENYITNIKFDKTCAVTAEEIKSNVFSHFELRDGKKESVIYKSPHLWRKS